MGVPLVQGFISKPYQELDETLIRDIVQKLRDEVSEEVGRAQGVYKKDLEGALSYLNPEDLHFAEGRSFAIDKKSFSVTEIQNAAKLPSSLRIKYLVYRYRFNYYTRNGILTEFPTVLCIEPSSACNLRCIMCFQHDESFSGNKEYMGVMDMDLYKKVIDEGAENGLCSIVLASRGEPTLHKNIAEMIAYARQRGIIDIKINTNAMRLTNGLSRKLLKAFGDHGINTVVFSVDSADQEEFERLRPGAKFDQIVENIKDFNRIRKEEFPETPVRTRVSATLVKGYVQDIDKSRRFWSEMVDEFAMHEANDRVDIYHHKPNGETRWCGQIFERLYIWFDGTVNPCDEDYKSELKLGNIRDTSIKEMWCGEVMSKYRAIHKDGRRGKLFPCDRCYRVNG